MYYEHNYQITKNFLGTQSILKENDIQYIKEYSFSDLVGEKEGKLRFDFAIF